MITDEEENEKFSDLPQLDPVLPINWLVSEFHKNFLNDSHLPIFGGGV